MITKKEILKMVRHVHKRSQGRANTRIIHPYREWAIGVLAAGFLLLAAIAYSGYLYVQFNTIETRLDTPQPKVVRYQENDVARALEFYSARRDMYLQALDLPVAVETTATSSTTTTQETVIQEEVVIDSEIELLAQ